MKVKSIILDKDCNVSLTAYILDCDYDFGVDKRPAVIVFPGGGYKTLSAAEGETVALNYNAVGYHTFVLRYSVGEKFTNGKPLKDYEKAYEYILSRAEEWRIMTDKIAVIGFSAGGHLAASAATMSKYCPQAALLGYAVTLEETVKALDMGTDSPYEHITDTTCPTFLFATATDLLVPVKNTLLYAERLHENKVPFECHIYSKGNHGFSLGTNTFVNYGVNLCERVENWFKDSVTWLAEIFAVRTQRHNDAEEGEISVDASLKTLYDDERAREVIAKYLPFFNDYKSYENVAHISLRRMLEHSEDTKKLVPVIAKELEKIKNS